MAPGFILYPGQQGRLDQAVVGVGVGWQGPTGPKARKAKGRRGSMSRLFLDAGPPQQVRPRNRPGWLLCSRMHIITLCRFSGKESEGVLPLALSDPGVCHRAPWTGLRSQRARSVLFFLVCSVLYHCTEQYALQIMKKNVSCNVL